MAVFAAMFLKDLDSWNGAIEQTSSDLEWIPSQASNVTYYEDFLRSIAEFNIDQSEFERWCHAQDKALHAVDNPLDTSIQRSIPMLASCGLIALPKTDPEDSYYKALQGLQWEKIELTEEEENSGPIVEERTESTGGRLEGLDS